MKNLWIWLSTFKNIVVVIFKYSILFGLCLYFILCLWCNLSWLINRLWGLIDKFRIKFIGLYLRLYSKLWLLLSFIASQIHAEIIFMTHVLNNHLLRINVALLLERLIRCYIIILINCLTLRRNMVQLHFIWLISLNSYNCVYETIVLSLNWFDPCLFLLLFWLMTPI